MKNIISFYKTIIGIGIFLMSSSAFCAGLPQTEAGIRTLQTSIHVIVGVVFLITGIIVGVLIWRGNKTWEECSKWVIGVIFAGSVSEFLSMFFL